MDGPLLGVRHFTAEDVSATIPLSSAHAGRQGAVHACAERDSHCGAAITIAGHDARGAHRLCESPGSHGIAATASTRIAADRAGRLSRSPVVDPGSRDAAVADILKPRGRDV